MKEGLIFISGFALMIGAAMSDINSSMAGFGVLIGIAICAIALIEFLYLPSDTGGEADR